VLETIRTQAASAEVTIHPMHMAASANDVPGALARPTSVCTIPIERPARRIQCSLLSEKQTGDREKQLVEARKALTNFMSTHQVCS
jgi:hypothetical protein